MMTHDGMMVQVQLACWFFRDVLPIEKDDFPNPVGFGSFMPLWGSSDLGKEFHT